MPAANADIIRQLQRDILPLQGFKPPTAGKAVEFHLGPLETAFPNHRLPTGAIHEFVSRSPQQSAAANGFLAGVLGALMKNGGVCLWIGGGHRISDAGRNLFPPGFSIYGVAPDRLLFFDLPHEKDRAWAMEEALKCEALTAVVGEISEIDFTGSRRLQLAVEQSRVTGFLLRHSPRSPGPVASVARWGITSLASQPEPGLPGIGFPRWQVDLQKVRNGRPGSWIVQWSAGRFHIISPPATQLAEPQIAAAHKRLTG